MAAKTHCLPVDNGYPVIATSPGCKNGWGWLKEGECGCVAGSPGWNAELGGCSVRCISDGPLDCPNCAKPVNWLLVGAGAVGLYLLFGRR